MEIKNLGLKFYSCKIVGWSIDDTMRTPLINNALIMTLQHRNPKQGLLWHYASVDHRKLCQKDGIVQRMSRKGNCWDNSVAESFFYTLKTELVYQTIS